MMNQTYWRICGVAVLLALPGVFCLGQAMQPGASLDDDAVVVLDELPDAPSAKLGKGRVESILKVPPRITASRPARKFHRVVRPDEFTLPLSSKDKLELSVMSRLTAADLASALFSAGWSHIRDSAPHYGSDRGGFGERLGALALKQTTQSILSYGVYASLFHDDPRYYVMGRQQAVSARALYSASRPFITKKDNGTAAINWPVLAGIASTTALTNLYYPARDRGFANGAKAFGVSLGTSILNDEIHEFIGDAIRLVRRHKN